MARAQTGPLELHKCRQRHLLIGHGLSHEISPCSSHRCPYCCKYDRAPLRGLRLQHPSVCHPSSLYVRRRASHGIAAAALMATLGGVNGRVVSLSVNASCAHACPPRSAVGHDRLHGDCESPQQHSPMLGASPHASVGLLSQATTTISSSTTSKTTRRREIAHGEYK